MRYNVAVWLYTGKTLQYLTNAWCGHTLGRAVLSAMSANSPDIPGSCSLNTSQHTVNIQMKMCQNKITTNHKIIASQMKHTLISSYIWPEAVKKLTSTTASWKWVFLTRGFATLLNDFINNIYANDLAVNKSDYDCDRTKSVHYPY